MPHFRSLCRRLSLNLVRLGVLALLLNTVFMGLHHPPALLAAFIAPDTACTDLAAIADPDETGDDAPVHGGIRCPFCTLAQGGKLVPPSPWLVFPPASVPIVRAPPESDRSLSTIPVAAHRSRGPPG